MRRRHSSDDPQPLEPLLEHYDLDVPAKHGWVKVRCPFHDEDIPSCVVNVEDGGFSCFACGAKGRGPVSFIMQREQVDHDAALAVYREVYGDASPRPSEGRTAPKRVARGGYRPSFRRRAHSPLA